MKNNFKSSILSFIRSLQIPAAGITGDGVTYSKVVCLFPYYTGKRDAGNLSMYAYSKDYHTIVSSYLLQIADYIRTLSPNSHCTIHVDKGEGNDKKAAFEAGIGFWGRNNLIIHETFGSFCFIGYVETDIPLPPDAPLSRTCIGCGKCEAHCPGGAIQDGKINPEKCASAISQKRGSLSAKETEILIKSGYVWGCDICQTVCPHNERIPETPLRDFYVSPIFSVKEVSMSNKAFSALYGDRAFSWRGKAVLKRNLDLLSSHEKGADDHTK